MVTEQQVRTGDNSNNDNDNNNDNINNNDNELLNVVVW